MASSGTNVKMGVSGVAQFKQSMNQAKQAVKTLDAQLNLTEKQFKQSGDAESYMAEKTMLLQTKLERQKDIVDNAQKALDDMAKNGIDRASKAYQDMYRQMINAKGELLDTQNEMESIGTSADDAADGVSEMNSQLKVIGKDVSFDTVITGLDNITGKMEAAAKKAINLGRKLVTMTLGAGGWADELVTDASVWTEAMGIEITPEQLYRMQQTERLIDTSADTILASKKKLITAMGKEDSQDTMGAFAALGIDPNQWHDDIDGLFWEAGQKLMNEKDIVKKNEYAMRLFGKSWEDLAPLFRAGRKEYERTMESWSWIGDDNLENLTEMDDKYQQLTSEWENFQRKFESALAPALTSVMETLVGLLEKFNQYMETPEGQAMLEALGEAVKGLVSDLAEIDPESVMAGIKGIFDDLVKGFQWMAENKETVLGFVKGFGIAWAALKGVSIITKVLKLINAITGLTSSGAAAAGTAAGSSWASAFATAAMKAAPFLAFLYTLLKPASTSDELGNGDLYDENGELNTAALEASGVKVENGEAQMIAPTQFHGKFSQSQYDLLQGYWDKYRTGTATNDDWAALQKAFGFGTGGGMWDRFTELAAGMYKLDRTMEDLPEELFADPNSGNNGTSEMTTAAKNMNGLPAQIKAAVIDGMSSVKIYIDGYPMGQVMTPYVNSAMGGLLAGITKG